MLAQHMPRPCVHPYIRASVPLRCSIKKAKTIIKKSTPHHNTLELQLQNSSGVTSYGGIKYMLGMKISDFKQTRQITR